MISPYLTRAPRTLEQVQRQNKMRLLKDIAESYRQRELQCENGSSTSWRDGDRFRERAEAVEWAMDELDKAE